MKIALIQMKQSRDAGENLERAKRLIREADADLIVLPEAFIAPFGTELLDSHDFLCDEFKNLAREVGSVIVAGTFPEKSGEDFYNTSFVFDESGELIAKYRKIHLFDVALKNLKTSESERYRRGNEAVVFDYGDTKIGLAVCYDLRFPELFTTLTDMGAEVIIVPAAFSYQTGKRDWEVLNRARALDSQCFLLSCAPAQNRDFPFPVYGHSMVVAPDGEILAQAGEGEEILEIEIDLEETKDIRSALPVTRARREIENERNSI